MRRICSAIALLFAASVASAGVLVQYSFDDGLTDTGPDTFAVFQNAKGHVRLATDIRFSGYRSIELRDVAGDGDFPELQGYFPERKSGDLFFHFAMLVANPDQSLNIALAGPSHFTMSKDGIALWLKTSNGVMHHVSDSIPKKLFMVERFVWYAVDVRYRITTGTYDLTIHKEGVRDAIVALRDQPNATNTAESSVDKFSFVGSVFEDDSNVTYYVDDVVIGTDENIILKPFVAPGRRKLFIDYWREVQKLATKRGCPPVLSAADYASSEAMYKEWQSACTRMDPDEFASLAKQHPDAPIFALSELAAIKEHDRALQRWRQLAPRLSHDARYAMIAAQHKLDDYYTRLWNGEYATAAKLAEENGWEERVGDALFLSGSPSQARRYYEEALRKDPHAYWPTVKLSDIFHLLGDTANEKLYRERLYGHLQ